MSRRRLAVGSILAAALVAACGPDWDALDPSLGEAGAGGAGGADQCQDDGKECTIDTCAGPVTQHTPVAPGTPCTQGGGAVCNEGGECVECVVASDCPGADEDCKKRTCTPEGTCSASFVPAGDEVPTQKDGDCKKAVCNGMGVVQNLLTPADVPVDGNDCTDDVCDAAGNPENPFFSVGHPCVGANGAAQCNGSGACVQCNQPSDCGASSACVAQACDAAGMCDPTPELDAGASCGVGMRCDGEGGCVTCQSASVTPLVSLGVPQIVPNNDATGVTSTILAAGLATKIVDVNVTVNITGDTSGDLSASLLSPSGTVIDLTSGNGGLNDDSFAGTTFDDDSPGKRVTEATFINGMAATSLIPERNLGRLNGEDPNGTWELVVKDLGVTGTGAILSSWSMSITAQEDNLIFPSASFQSANAVATLDGQEVASPVAVTGVPGVIYEATVTIDLAHKAAEQLVITLASPAGKTIPLSTNNGAMDVFKGTTFEDGAANLIGCVGSGCVAFVNNIVVTSAIPEGSLSALVGDDPNGTWSLKVLDTANGQAGVLTSWSLDLTPALCSVKP